MSQLKSLIILFFLFSDSLYPKTASLIDASKLPLANRLQQRILEDNYIYVSSDVNSDKVHQSLFFQISGLHKKSCSWALGKLSRYEQFNQYLDFVKESKYENGRVNFLLDSPLMPFRMRLNFVLPRIEKEGVYNFAFDRGFLKGLKGEIHVSSYNRRCLFFTKAKWAGKKSKIPDSVFELFSITLGRLSMQTLFRISS